ncbi:MAG: hypothetical protein ACTSXO_03430 [Candidatus Heimdallarchaeota archaeon]
MNEIATLAVTIVGISIILVTVGIMFFFIIEDLINTLIKRPRKIAGEKKKREEG